MTSKILITGISGFIGRNVLRQLVQSHDSITAIIRPGTKHQRIEKFVNKVEFAEIDLTDIPTLKEYLDENYFEIIIHIGAVRGGRKLSNPDYFDANVNATEQFVINARDNDSKFIFCSSVGVFGAIPLELPANNFTKRQEDNYYHFTKIRAEAIIQKYVLYGLKAAIIRPSITYGTNDYGFPFTLTKLIDKKLLFLPNQDVIIHLANIHVITQSFLRLIEIDYQPGVCYNVADSNPVELHKLTEFINNELKGKSYSSKKNLDLKYFKKGEKLAKFFKSELWIARFQLISRHWYYDVENSYTDLSLKETDTIPNFKIVTDWYKNLRSK
ncbi:MAG: NAD(P)-dependent oxidoreductase [Candidatus Tenebribacter burtonii]|jgi:nucleoside-diphosphate-sugar epimerase|nr:NAD(P)-dependent oxidoreductase [Candidatus Tenebribacter burtonii]